MAPVLETKQDTILAKDITWMHLVVAVRDGKEPLILSKGYSEYNSCISFKIIKSSGVNNITYGNGYDFSPNENTPGLMVEEALRRGFKVAVFESKDWKQALQWLINNA